MQKAIGFIACVSVMAASLYLFSGGDPSRVLSAQTESNDSDSYGAVARRFMNDARQLAQQGNIREARRLAETAASLSASWNEGEVTPQQFLAELDGGSAGQSQNPFSMDDSANWPAIASESETSATGNPFATAESAKKPAPEPALPENASVAMVNKFKAQKLMKEAKAALKVNDFAVARARAMQARAMKVSWGLWDERPDHLLAEIDQADGTTTFLADGHQAGQSSDSSTAEDIYQKASKLIAQAREAMDAGNLQKAIALADEAEALDASYGLFEDSPKIVKQDIERLSQSGAAPGIAFNSGHQSTEPGSAEEQQARQLLQEARLALQEGNLSVARQKAAQAQEFNVTYTLLEDRPELVLSDVEQALSGQAIGQQFPSQSVAQAPGAQEDPAFANFAQNGPVDMTPASGNSGNPFAANGGVVTVSNTQTDEGFVVPPENDSNAPQFPEFDTVETAQADSPMDPMAKSDPLVDAANELDVRFTRLRTEVLNASFRAAKLKEKNPEEALTVLGRTREELNAADLPEESKNVLASHLDRAQQGVETWMEQQAPIIAMENRNRNVKEAIEAEVKNQIRIEQEFADLTNQYNDLMRQHRYAEAELIAKKARDLNPKLPQATIMVEKAKLQRSVANIADFKEKKDENSLKALHGVDETMAMPFVDFGFPDVETWAALRKRREGYGSGDVRPRTESEQKIEKALSETISLHFHDVPLTDIIRHVATTHGINIALDTRAIETEGLLVNQSVSIDVDGITLRSALNLLLDQAGGLVYDIENEVLKITNRLEQETTFKTRVYNVADLVVPMDQKGPGTPLDTDKLNRGLTGGADGLGLYQVNDDLAVSIGGNGQPRRGNRTLADDKGPDFGSLIDLITTTVEPGSWDFDGGDGRLHGDENTLSLVIRQTPSVHDDIVELLTQLRKLQDIQVTVEVRFISVTDRFFERIGVDFDFNVQDTLGDPPGTPAFGSRQLQFPGGAGGGGAGGGQAGDLRGNTNQGGGGQQQGAVQGLFDTVNRVNSPRDDFGRTVVGLASPDNFTQDYDIQFRQGSFELGVPDFGNFNPDAGIQVGMAILSDIEAFFFIQAAQADERANLLFAPKVTMFNGQTAFITDTTQRPFVTGLIPSVSGSGVGVGFTPILTTIQDGITLTVQAVVSADRRYVRLNLSPFFSNLVDVFTFSFAGGAGGQQGGQQGGGGFGGGGGGFGGGGGGFGGGGGGGQFGFGGIGGQGGFGGGGGGFGGGGGGFGGGGQQGQLGNVGGGTQTVQQPVVEVISVQTTVSVPDGGTVLLGGIKRLREGRNMAGVPILNKIPYVSRLFKNSGVGRETESVMMMVTPRIIIQDEEEELILGTSGG